MNVLDLFSGIGGFSLGLERAGFKTVAFCEVDPFCRAVLRKHWPDVPIFGDIRELTAEAVGNATKLLCNGSAHNARGNSQGTFAVSQPGNASCIDVICGGFPCQDISVAGKGAGIEGERSGLWKEYARIIGEVRPRYVIVENVAALLNRGLERVLGDLAALGYDAEWHCIPASAVGAPHRRDRVWIVAHPARIQSGRQEQRTVGERIGECGQSIDVADTDKPRLERWLRESLSECADEWIAGTGDSQIPDSGRQQTERHGSDFRAPSQRDWWLSEPNVGRVANGVPARVDRLRALGNAIVPQIAEIIGKAIIASEIPVRE